MIKNIVRFIVGAATGSGVTYYFVKKKLEEEYGEKIEATNRYVERLEKQILDEYSPENESEEIVEGIEPIHEERKAIAKINQRRPTHDYSANYQYRKYDADPADSEHPEDDEYDVVDKLGYDRSERLNSGKKPKLITQEEYDDAEFDYLDKVVLEYFTEDDILYNTEDDEIVVDREAILGDSMEKFGFTKNNEAVIYVRNYSRGSDYEIHKNYCAYGD